MKFRTTLVAAAALALAAGAQAASLYTFSGDTTGAPTFDRPFSDFSDLSPNGTGVHYSTFTFTVDVDDEYSFVTTGTFDTFLLLYSPSFNAADGTANGLIANDDLVSFTTSGFATDLVAGQSYTLVITGFDSGEFGNFTTTIGGEGVVSAVPDASSWALMALGLGAVGTVVRRRSVEAA